MTTAPSTTPPNPAEDTANHDTLTLLQQEDQHSDIEDVTLANYLNGEDDPALCDSDRKDQHSACNRII
jgi:hypothetical protein